MTRRCGFYWPALALIVFCPVVRGGAIVNTSLRMTQLQILPASGTLDILSGFNTTAFTSVYDSLGGSAQQFDSEFDTTASASSATALAYATGTASAPNLTASATSGVNITGVAASAGTNAGAPYGVLNFGAFEITDASGDQNPVDATLNAFLSASQSLSTDPLGLEATSEVTFNLDLYDSDLNLVTSLFLDNPLAIGPGSSLSQSSTPELTIGTVAMMTNSDYYLYAEVDAESSGLNSTPEPSYGVLTGALISLLIVIRAKRGHRPDCNDTRRG